MGWASWNNFAGSIESDVIRQQTGALVSSGMAAAGYQYVDLDDGWWQGDRNADGSIAVDTDLWPSGMQALADYIRSKGLKAGIYTDAGRQGCGYCCPTTRPAAPNTGGSTPAAPPAARSAPWSRRAHAHQHQDTGASLAQADLGVHAVVVGLRQVAQVGQRQHLGDLRRLAPRWQEPYARALRTPRGGRLTIRSSCCPSRPRAGASRRLPLQRGPGPVAHSLGVLRAGLPTGADVSSTPAPDRSGKTRPAR